MSHWNYRVCKETRYWEFEDKGQQSAATHSIREAYYNKDGGIWAVTLEPKPITAEISDFDLDTESECIESMKSQMELMQLAYSKPVLDLDTFVFADMDK